MAAPHPHARSLQMRKRTWSVPLGLQQPHSAQSLLTSRFSHESQPTFPLLIKTLVLLGQGPLLIITVPFNLSSTRTLSPNKVTHQGFRTWTLPLSWQCSSTHGQRQMQCVPHLQFYGHSGSWKIFGRLYFWESYQQSVRLWFGSFVRLLQDKVTPNELGALPAVCVS